MKIKSYYKRYYYRGDKCLDCKKPIIFKSKSKMCISCCRKKERSPLWKGNNASYFSKHIHINKYWQKKGICERCNSNNKKTEWSNSNKKYDRLNKSNWEELCKSCHRKKDVTINFRKFRKKEIYRIKPWNYTSLKIIQLDKKSKKIKSWNSISEASKELKILHTSIVNCLKQRSMTAGRFKWKYG